MARWTVFPSWLRDLKSMDMYRGKITKVVLLSKKFCILWYRHTKTCRESNRTIALVLFLVQILPTQWTISFLWPDHEKKIVNQYVLGALVIIQYHIIHLSLKVYFQLDRNPPKRSRTQWRNYISQLAWQCLWLPWEEMENIAVGREMWNTLLSLQLTLTFDKQKKWDVWHTNKNVTVQLKDL